MSWKTKLQKDHGAQALLRRQWEGNQRKLKLTVSYGKKSLTVDCIEFVQGDDQNHYKQTIPAGFYLIGIQQWKFIHCKWWFPLFKLKQDESGFYEYQEKIKGTQRNTFAIHPGTLSYGCVTVNKDFDKVKAILNKGQVIYNNQGYCGFLTVQPLKKIIKKSQSI